MRKKHFFSEENTSRVQAARRARGAPPARQPTQARPLPVRPYLVLCFWLMFSMFSCIDEKAICHAPDAVDIDTHRKGKSNGYSEDRQQKEFHTELASFFSQYDPDRIAQVRFYRTNAVS
jgi:hypothetical protein